jgi:hypothetical protein
VLLKSFMLVFLNLNLGAYGSTAAVCFGAAHNLKLRSEIFAIVRCKAACKQRLRDNA